jgi:asparagine synthase (glutamine-hydrolysing)
MCGILGIFPSPTDLDLSLLNVLKHRGPDDSGWQEVKGGVLGHTRLSIIDLSEHAHQPMQDPNSNYVLVFNGELAISRGARSVLNAFAVCLPFLFMINKRKSFFWPEIALA